MRWTWSAVAMLLALGCFDPLYEVEAGSSWSACCRNDRVDTCACTDVASCGFDIHACAGGACVESGVCSSGSGGSSGAGGGSAGTGGGAGGGFNPDAGVPLDAGAPSDAGQGGGQGGGTGGGGAEYELCCPDSTQRLTSCLCPAAGCTHTPFTACAAGACVPGAQTRCPD